MLSVRAAHAVQQILSWNELQATRPGEVASLGSPMRGSPGFDRIGPGLQIGDMAVEQRMVHAVGDEKRHPLLAMVSQHEPHHRGPRQHPPGEAAWSDTTAAEKYVGRA